MNVLSVAYPLAPVSRDAVGGAEQVLCALDAALIRAGHGSLMVACEGSQSAGTLLVSGAPADALSEAARRQAQAAHQRVILEALKSRPIDLIHLHGVDCLGYLPPPGIPVLITLHLPPDWYPPELFTMRRPGTWIQCVSESQQAACPPCAALLAPIANGVDLEAFQPAPPRRRFALSLGRVCEEKGFHLAAEAARRARTRLLIAGQVYAYEAHQRYFCEQLLPQLDSARRFIGPVGLRKKTRLLTGARCVLIPSLVEETSSLVAMEALACGTPVIAFPSGALARIVEHRKTGFLVRNAQEMAAAIRAAASIDPKDCRAAAEERFSVRQTVARYLELYGRLIGGKEALGVG